MHCLLFLSACTQVSVLWMPKFLCHNETRHARQQNVNKNQPPAIPRWGIIIFSTFYYLLSFYKLIFIRKWSEYYKLKLSRTERWSCETEGKEWKATPIDWMIVIIGRGQPVEVCIAFWCMIGGILFYFIFFPCLVVLFSLSLSLFLSIENGNCNWNATKKGRKNATATISTPCWLILTPRHAINTVSFLPLPPSIRVCERAFWWDPQNPSSIKHPSRYIFSVI